MELSATSTMVTGPVGECLQVGTENASVRGRPASLRRFMILAPDINIQTYLCLTLNEVKLHVLTAANEGSRLSCR